MTPRPPSPQRFLVLPAVRPRLTYVLLAINVLAFLPQLSGASDGLLPLGAMDNTAVVAGEWWRLITPIFLHVNLPHILVNSISLYILGLQAEALLGYQRFLIVYLLSGISGNVFMFAFSQGQSAGASGAIFGLVGFMIIYFYRHRQLFGESGRRQLINALVVAAGNFLFGLVSELPIGNWAHFGGLVGGAVLTWLLGPVYALKLDPLSGRAEVLDSSPLSGQRWLSVLAVVLALAAAALLIARSGG